jgi:cysteine-rich repeat protein
LRNKKGEKMKKTGALLLVIVLTIICSLVLVGFLATGNKCEPDDLECNSNQPLELRTKTDTSNSFLSFEIDSPQEIPIIKKLTNTKPKVIRDYYNYSVGGSSGSRRSSRKTDDEDTSVCGNGVKEKSEQCDDGNRLNGDGCDSRCKLEIHGIEKDCDDFGFDFPVSKWECNGNWHLAEEVYPGSIVTGTCETASWNTGISKADGIVVKAGSTVYYNLVGSSGIVNQQKPAISYITFCGYEDECIINSNCDDDNLCTEDICSEGSCQYSDISCDDSVGCTIDTCDPEIGCTNTPDDNICNDGLWCNGAEMCDAEFDCIQSTAPCVYYVDECTDVTCDEDNDLCVETPVEDCCIEDSDCSDLDDIYCSVNSLVTVQGKCLQGSCVAQEISSEDCSSLSDTYMQCGEMNYICSDDEDACIPDEITPDDTKCPNTCCEDTRNIGYCDATTFLCNYVPEDCNDYDTSYCDGSKIIEDDYTCESGSCTLDDRIELECDNEVYCDGQETCENANCVGADDIDCADGNECTDDTCNEDIDSCENDNTPVMVLETVKSTHVI